jgi:hypothetical protein
VEAVWGPLGGRLEAVWGPCGGRGAASAWPLLLGRCCLAAAAWPLLLAAVWPLDLLGL